MIDTTIISELRFELAKMEKERDHFQAHYEAAQLNWNECLKELDILRAKPSPLLQCVDCRNTESPAGAMARMFNHGRCLHCGGYFKVIRA